MVSPTDLAEIRQVQQSLGKAVKDGKVQKLTPILVNTEICT